MSTHSLPAVLARLKLMTGTQSDAELSRALSISPQTLSSWKVRESIPYAFCVALAQQQGCSLDWLLLGHTAANTAPDNDGHWEQEILEQLRVLPADDRRAVALFIRDKQRIQHLQWQLARLTGDLATAGTP
ncbi:MULTISPECIES: helix-turn-helix domain-containing protein [Pseudomonas]|uniref:Bacteriophage CI repressor n=1 Tax=Pseudomonas mosselii TaxID=78327 RepID=A0A5R8YLT6_9PSED|nr:helix-turn-helix domain-containing protein [Pseudomonas mosselii]TLP54410.1 bacteriophage CI repressor [Pseudomonas mosselii]